MSDKPRGWRANRRAAQYIKAIEETALKYGLPTDLLGALIERESQFNPAAKSRRGALGIAQIVPRYHPNVNPLDPFMAIDYAGNYLSQNVRRFNGDIRRALAAYNHGPTAIAKYGAEWEKRLPKETRNYVDALSPYAVSTESLKQY